MTRTTRSLKTQSQRHTRKRSHLPINQHGGAEFVKLTEEARRVEWATVLPKEIPTLLTGFDSVPKADPEQERVRRRDIMTRYMNGIEHMDTMFDGAFRLIWKMIQRKRTIPLPEYKADASEEEMAAWRLVILKNTQKLEGYKTEALTYIYDVEKAINFVLDTDIDPTEGPTKLQTIAAEPLSTFLIYPRRLTNTLLLGLAASMVALNADNEDILTRLQASDNSGAAIDIFADTWIANIHSMAYAITARDLRDGYFLGQGITGFIKDEKTFWQDFLRELLRIRTQKIVTPFVNETKAGCRRYIKESSWGFVAAHVYLSYTQGKLESILDFFKKADGDEEFALGRTRSAPTTGCDAPLSDAERAGIPDGAYDAIPVTPTGTTYGEILSQMEDSQLQFILQLKKALKPAS